MTENQIAKVKWNEIEGRYELRILNQLKAYSSGEDRAKHEEGKKELCSMAKTKGYTVIEG